MVLHRCSPTPVIDLYFSAALISSMSCASVRIPPMSSPLRKRDGVLSIPSLRAASYEWSMAASIEGSVRHDLKSGRSMKRLDATFVTFSADSFGSEKILSWYCRKAPCLAAQWLPMAANRAWSWIPRGKFQNPICRRSANWMRIRRIEAASVAQ
jgi:hypothetical protein